LKINVHSWEKNRFTSVKHHEHYTSHPYPFVKKNNSNQNLPVFNPKLAEGIDKSYNYLVLSRGCFPEDLIDIFSRQPSNKVKIGECFFASFPNAPKKNDKR